MQIEKRIQKYDGWDDDERAAYESYANAEYIPADSPYEKIIKNEEEGYGPDMYGFVQETFDVSDTLLVHCAEAKITTVFEFDLANGEQFDLSKLSLFREYDSEPSPLGEGCRFVDIIRYDNKIVSGKADVKLKACQGYLMFLSMTGLIVNICAEIKDFSTSFYNSHQQHRRWRDKGVSPPAIILSFSNGKDKKH